MTRVHKVALAFPIAVFVVMYAVSVGHGFVADDFTWIAHSRVTSVTELPALFGKSTGFYRPIVAVTFAADYALFGNQPLGYGLTNLALALACGALLYQVARAFVLPRAAALLAVALWFLNPHGINTAILWMSGRTALMLTLGGLGAALLMLRGRPFAALAPAAVALFSKEEAVFLPVILFVWWLMACPEETRPRRRVVLWILACCALLGVYLLLRFRTDAMTPWNAPAYYRFTANPRILFKNVWEYADRSMTFSFGVAALAAIVLRTRSHARWTSRPMVICGLTWLVAGYGLTVFLPVRSSLYACFPSVGACLIAADIAARRWTIASEPSRRIAVVVGLAAAAAMIPISTTRNRTTIANARFSRSILADLDAATRGVPNGATVVVVDDRTRRPNIETAFNTALNEGFELASGRRLTFWVEPPLHAYAAADRPCASCAAAVITTRGGRVVQ